MKIDGTAPTQGPEGRRFQAAKSIPAKEGGKSFGALLKKAAGAPAGTPAPAPSAGAATSPPVQAQTSPVSEPKPAKQDAESSPADFANHMEMVKLRLKSGFYNNTNVEDALSEKLTGFFDDLA